MSSALLPDDVFRRLCRARSFLHEHHAEPLTIARLAREAGISRFHFLRLYRRAFGVTPRAHLTEVRIQRAKALLAAETASVTDICFDVGFSSLGSFSTMFAERVGCPPSAWRRRFWQVSAAWERPTALVIPSCFWRHYGDAAS